ncbi:hypothetical protein PUN28_013612 [Cardiocondyla obscurior]|uniref:Uncharacterized protein n=1 Tax=Cardiocondyla obscurior TaxID=286306 RepID=A0AAW2F3H8_9HYME
MDTRVRRSHDLSPVVSRRRVSIRWLQSPICYLKSFRFRFGAVIIGVGFKVSVTTFVIVSKRLATFVSSPLYIVVKYPSSVVSSRSAPLLKSSGVRAFVIIVGEIFCDTAVGDIADSSFPKRLATTAETPFGPTVCVITLVSTTCRLDTLDVFSWKNLVPGTEIILRRAAFNAATLRISWHDVIGNFVCFDGGIPIVVFGRTVFYSCVIGSVRGGRLLREEIHVRGRVNNLRVIRTDVCAVNMTLVMSRGTVRRSSRIDDFQKPGRLQRTRFNVGHQQQWFRGSLGRINFNFVVFDCASSSESKLFDTYSCLTYFDLFNSFNRGVIKGHSEPPIIVRSLRGINDVRARRIRLFVIKYSARSNEETGGGGGKRLQQRNGTRSYRNVIDLESGVNVCNEFDSFSCISSPLRLHVRPCHNRHSEYTSASFIGHLRRNRKKRKKKKKIGMLNKLIYLHIRDSTLFYYIYNVEPRYHRNEMIYAYCSQFSDRKVYYPLEKFIYTAAPRVNTHMDN